MKWLKCAIMETSPYFVVAVKKCLMYAVPVVRWKKIKYAVNLWFKDTSIEAWAPIRLWQELVLNVSCQIKLLWI